MRQPTLLITVRYHEQTLMLDRQQARIATQDNQPTEIIRGATAGGDERKLRGIPAIGRGVTGAITGSIPHQNAA